MLTDEQIYNVAKKYFFRSSGVTGSWCCYGNTDYLPDDSIIKFGRDLLRLAEQNAAGQARGSDICCGEWPSCQKRCVPLASHWKMRAEAAEKELERERMRLAACGVVAMADTPKSASEARDMHQDYRSASCEDVTRRVDECMVLRDRLKATEKELESYRNRR